MNITPADFLQLITAQMKDQNPLQPADPTQFLSQLEQMSQVSSMQSMQSSLTNLQTSLQSSQMANGAALIGQTVLAPANTAMLDSPAAASCHRRGNRARAAQASHGQHQPAPTARWSNTFQVAPAASGLTQLHLERHQQRTARRHARRPVHGLRDLERRHDQHRAHAAHRVQSIRA